MAQNFNYYNLVGDDGYGLFTSWDDLQEAALKLKGSLYFRGYVTAGEAYKGILKNVMFRWKIRQVGVIDLPTLMKKQLVLLDTTETETETEEPEVRKTVGSIYRNKPHTGGRKSITKTGSLADILAEDEDDQEPVELATSKDPEEEIIQFFKSWYIKHKNEEAKRKQ